MENNVLYFNLYTRLLCFWATKAWRLPNHISLFGFLSARHAHVQPQGRDVAVGVHLIAHKMNSVLDGLLATLPEDCTSFSTNTDNIMLL
jgi:hypothetical protein